MDTTTNVNKEERLYSPSWVDRFTDWVGKLPIQPWIFYAGLGVVLILIQMFFLRLDGNQQFDAILPVIIFNALAIPYLLALIHMIDNQAVMALNSMRSSLAINESDFDHYKYSLSNMPFLAPLIAGLIMTVITILTAQVSIVPFRYAALEQLPVFTVVFHIVDKSSAFLVGVFIYHTIRQLRLVNTINVNHIRVNLFHIKPIQAFSRLTASTAVGLVVFVYSWMFINPELLTDPIIFGYLVFFTILAVSIFVWPLVGTHRLMENEKERMLHEIDLRFEAAFSDFNQRFLKDDDADIERTNGTISSLEIQHKRIMSTPTWPWRPETAQFALTAIALPLILMVLRFLVERAFGV
jgi:hypothetical protein